MLSLVAVIFAAIAEASVLISNTSVPPAAGCGKPLPEGQSVGNISNVTLTSGGYQRSYLISIPPNYNSYVQTALILSYHGGTRTAEDQLMLDDLTNPKFNPDSFVIYPQGINNAWQGVPGVTVNDVQFTADILDQVQRLYCIDRTRISATGKSDGGGFCNILACDPILSTRIAAFAPVSGAYYVDTLPCMPLDVSIPCAPGRKDVPFLAFHGGNDTTIPYEGGERRGECLPAIPHFIQQWAARDGLGYHNITTPVSSNTVSYKFEHGFNTGLVEHIYDSVIGHDWPSTAPNADNQVEGHHVASFNATPIIVEFFKLHPLNFWDRLTA